jgi:hypothetical protein
VRGTEGVDGRCWDRRRGWVVVLYSGVGEWWVVYVCVCAINFKNDGNRFFDRVGEREGIWCGWRLIDYDDVMDVGGVHAYIRAKGRRKKPKKNQVTKPKKTANEQDLKNQLLQNHNIFFPSLLFPLSSPPPFHHHHHHHHPTPPPHTQPPPHIPPPTLNTTHPSTITSAPSSSPFSSDSLSLLPHSHPSPHPPPPLLPPPRRRRRRRRQPSLSLTVPW